MTRNRSGPASHTAPRGRQNILLVGAVVAAVALSCSAVARAEDGCAPAITTAEQENNELPAHILHAIGVVESGRRDPVTGQLDPWPWSVNAGGDSRIFDTRGEAIAFVRNAQARGIRSIDVGCMQVNLMYHSDAFASLEEAFTPESNVRYAAAFLLDLRQRTGGWLAAAGNYHSATPALSADYARRVQAILAGEQEDRVPSLQPFPLTLLVGPRSHLTLTGATRRVRVFEPETETAAAWQNFIPGATRLPRVYHP